MFGVSSDKLGVHVPESSPYFFKRKSEYMSSRGLMLDIGQLIPDKKATGAIKKVNSVLKVF